MPVIQLEVVGDETPPARRRKYWKAAAAATLLLAMGLGSYLGRATAPDQGSKQQIAALKVVYSNIKLQVPQKTGDHRQAWACFELVVTYNILADKLDGKAQRVRANTGLPRVMWLEDCPAA